MRIALLLWTSGALAFAATAPELFETQVRPFLAAKCFVCHGAEKQFSGLRVDGRQGLIEGGKRGPAIVPGAPEQSLLLKALRHDGLAMPPGGKAGEKEIAAVEEWIRAGAVWPESTGIPKQTTYDWYDKAARSHWSFQPLQRPTAQRAIDDSIRQALQARGLRMSSPADRRTLLRRASFVLRGLPPSAAEMDRFLGDSSPRAFASAVDAMLASPQFGEQWARQWMDVVRYGETRGYEWNYEIVGAWRYRDYLIRAFNADVPYDQFVREHIVGDLLQHPRIAGGRNESVIGTAFFRLGEAGHDDCIKFRELSLDVIDNQIDTLAKAFQGMTVSCARCHNHKLDPIPTDDYYGLFGILNSSRAMTHTINAKEPLPPAAQQIVASKPAIRAELARLWGNASKGLPEKGDYPMEHPLRPWIVMRASQDFARDWEKLAAEYRKERDTRAEFNRAQFTPFDDRLFMDGLGLRGGRSKAGDFAIATEGDAAITGVLPSGWHTHTITDGWNGAIRSTLLPKTHKNVSIQALGGKLAARRTVLDNCAIGEGYKIIENNSPAWIKLSTIANEKLPVFLEVITKHDNPRIPDRPGVLKKTPEEIASPRSYFGLMRVVLHNGDEPPREELGHMDRLFAEPVDSLEGLQARYQAIVTEIIARWSRDEAGDEEVRWLDALLASGVLSNRRDASKELERLVNAYRELESKLPAPEVIDGLGDAGDGFDTPVLRSGDPHSPGAIAPRHFLSKVGPSWPGPGKGSGRRALAEWIASPSNPLTARVMVNRVWSTLFGRGIVATADNLGQEGEKPSHPELLDALAFEFMNDGWSVKRLIRRIVLTQAFQQSSVASAEAQREDPRNRLLHHYPMRRLPAESVRDAILSTSGRLDLTMYGPSIPPHRTEPQDYRRLFNGPLDGKGRRSIYTQITRMEGPRFLEIFDYPNPMAARGVRDVTNVPAQALALLNDPFVAQQAEVWAQRMESVPASKRIDAMFRAALQRAPDAAERDRFATLATQLPMKDVAHVLFNLKEFLYIQ
jgi:mono/diheme cytochrome c family protein